MCVHMKIARGVYAIWQATKSGGAANRPLINVPVGPLEGLVVETSRPQRPRVIEHAQQIKARRWKAVLRLGAQSVDKRYLCRTDNGQHSTAVVGRKQATVFFNARRDDAARPMKLEAPTDDSLPVCKQGGRERIAAVSLQ